MIARCEWESKVVIQKHFALSPLPFSKVAEMISVAFKSVSPVDNVEI